MTIDEANTPETPILSAVLLGVTPNIGEPGVTTDTVRDVPDWAEQQDIGLRSFGRCTNPTPQRSRGSSTNSRATETK